MAGLPRQWQTRVLFCRKLRKDCRRLESKLLPREGQSNPTTKDQSERFVETIEVQACRSFGEEVLMPESIEKIQRVKTRHLGLMTGAKIKATHERLKLSQPRLTSLLQCGEKMLSHWENGHGHPTGLSNTILRLLDEGFISPKHLSAVAQPRAERGPVKRQAKARPATATEPAGKLEYVLREAPTPYRVSRTKKRID
jgi:DNA-binding transcriptional regulator YiaG